MSRVKVFGTHSGAPKFHERVRVQVPEFASQSVWLLKSGMEQLNLPCTFWDWDLKYLQRTGLDVNTAISLHYMLDEQQGMQQTYRARMPVRIVHAFLFAF